MSNYVIRSFVFILILILIIGLYIFFYSSLTRNAYGPTTKAQIEQSFENALIKDYEMLILGNSRIYRGINPDMFSTSAYNFAHDDDSYNQMYYKLQYVLAHKNIKYLILGVDYFQFSFMSDSRNYVYSQLLPKEYSNDYPLINKALLMGLDNYFGIDKFRTTLNALSTTIKGDTTEKAYLKDNGQYIKPGKATKNDKIIRDYKMLTQQKRYFELILDECEKKGIEVFMVMPPIRENELKTYPTSVISFYSNYFNKSAGQNVHFLDYSQNSLFEYTDYTDITHLNAASANRLSVLLNSRISTLLNSRIANYAQEGSRMVFTDRE
jgi:hypothetical protein